MSEDITYEKHCDICGRKHEYKKRQTYSSYCRYRKKIICVECEKHCLHYSEPMLPNGTHCELDNREETYKYRLLARRIVASPAEYEPLVPAYREQVKHQAGKVHDKLVDLDCKYKIAVTDEYKKQLRNEMAAIQVALREFVLKDPITKRMYERLGLGIGVTQNE